MRGRRCTYNEMPFGKSFKSAGPAVREWRSSNSSTDNAAMHASESGTLRVEPCGQLRPRGVVNMFRQHAAGEALDVEIFDPNAPKTRHELAGHIVQMIAPLGGDAPLELGELDLVFEVRLHRASCCCGRRSSRSARVTHPRALDALAVA